MTFKAKLDDPESRAFWDAVERGAKAYDDLPDWQKGIVRGVENADDVSDAGCRAQEQHDATEDPQQS